MAASLIEKNSNDTNHVAQKCMMRQTQNGFTPVEFGLSQIDFARLSDSYRLADLVGRLPTSLGPHFFKKMQMTLGNLSVQEAIKQVLRNTAYQATGMQRKAAADSLASFFSSANSVFPETKADGFEVDPYLESRISARRGCGKSLPGHVRSFMEEWIGTNFSDVQVHDDREANDITQAVSAQAFTNGNDIYFAEGKYLPYTKNGMKIIAHELVHNRQQRSASNELGLRVSSSNLSVLQCFGRKEISEMKNILYAIMDIILTMRDKSVESQAFESLEMPRQIREAPSEKGLCAQAMSSSKREPPAGENLPSKDMHQNFSEKLKAFSEGIDFNKLISDLYFNELYDEEFLSDPTCFREKYFEELMDTIGRLVIILKDRDSLVITELTQIHDTACSLRESLKSISLLSRSPKIEVIRKKFSALRDLANAGVEYYSTMMSSGNSLDYALKKIINNGVIGSDGIDSDKLRKILLSTSINYQSEKTHSIGEFWNLINDTCHGQLNYYTIYASNEKIHWGNILTVPGSSYKKMLKNMVDEDVPISYGCIILSGDSFDYFNSLDYYNDQKYVMFLNVLHHDYLRLLKYIFKLISPASGKSTFAKTSVSIKYSLIHNIQSDADNIKIAFSSEGDLARMSELISIYHNKHPHHFGSNIIPLTDWIGEGVSYASIPEDKSWIISVEGRFWNTRFQSIKMALSDLSTVMETSDIELSPKKQFSLLKLFTEKRFRELKIDPKNPSRNLDNPIAIDLEIPVQKMIEEEKISIKKQAKALPISDSKSGQHKSSQECQNESDRSLPIPANRDHQSSFGSRAIKLDPDKTRGDLAENEDNIAEEAAGSNLQDFRLQFDCLSISESGIIKKDKNKVIKKTSASCYMVPMTPGRQNARADSKPAIANKHDMRALSGSGSSELPSFALPIAKMPVKESNDQEEVKGTANSIYLLEKMPCPLGEREFKMIVREMELIGVYGDYVNHSVDILVKKLTNNNVLSYLVPPSRFNLNRINVAGNLLFFAFYDEITDNCSELAKQSDSFGGCKLISVEKGLSPLDYSPFEVAENVLSCSQRNQGKSGSKPMRIFNFFLALARLFARDYRYWLKLVEPKKEIQKDPTCMKPPAKCLLDNEYELICGENEMLISSDRSRNDEPGWVKLVDKYGGNYI